MDFTQSEHHMRGLSECIFQKQPAMCKWQEISLVHNDKGQLEEKDGREPAHSHGSPRATPAKLYTLKNKKPHTDLADVSNALPDDGTPFDAFGIFTNTDCTLSHVTMKRAK